MVRDKNLFIINNVTGNLSTSCVRPTCPIGIAEKSPAPVNNGEAKWGKNKPTKQIHSSPERPCIMNGRARTKIAN